MLVGRADRVLSVDQAGADMYDAIVGERGNSTVVPICFDPAVFRPGRRREARRSLGLSETSRVSVFVGRLEASKGTSLLVRAVADANKHCGESTLLVVGDGSQRRAMEAEAASLGVRVVFAGWLAQEELPMYLNAADVLLLPSEAEGMPTVVVESLACGTPVIAKSVGGLPDLIAQWSTGALLPGDDLGDWSRAICQAFETEWSTDHLVQSVERYTVESVCTQLDAVLIPLVGATVSTDRPSERGGRLR